MSYEGKSKEVRDWMTACGVIVGIFAIWATIWTANKSIHTQQEIVERQSRVALAEAAYRGFLDDLLPTEYPTKPNTRIPIAIFGSEGVFQEFVDLQNATKHQLQPFQGGSKLERALLDFLKAIRIDVLGGEHAVSDGMLRKILGIAEPPVPDATESP